MELAERAPAKTATLPAVVILAPPWRFGRRGAAKRAVEEAVLRWKRRGGPVAIACQAAAASALSASAEILIVPASETDLSALACALDACGDDPVLVADVEAEASSEAVAALLAVFAEDAAVAACLDRDGGLRRFPLLARRSLRPILEALMQAGETSLEALLRRPCARIATL